MRAIPVMLCACVIASNAAAQQRSLAAYDLPRDAERRLSRVIDDSATHRLEGPAEIAAGQTIATNVVAYSGPLIVSGRIDGQLIVIGGTIEFRPGAVVTGDVTVVDGEAYNVEAAQIGGTFTSYAEGFELYVGGERVFSVNPRRRRAADDWERDRDRHHHWGHSSIAVRTGTNYNRVEGLPILFGPAIVTGGNNPTRLEALGILRTGSGAMFDPDRMGYQLRVEQFVGGSGLRVGALARSVVEPIEDWNLTNLEASLATFLLHEDQRDYFEREGWSVYARVSPRGFSDLDVTVGYLNEEHGTLPARDPWTLFGDGAWRRQPLVAEGTLRALSARVEVDRRNDEEFPTSGFYLAGSFTRGLGGALQMPGRAAFERQPAEPPRQLNEAFSTGLVDVRLYRRVGVDATLAFRGVAGGALEDQELPPQFQHALGGAGTMPGYRLMSADCGARSQIVSRESDTRRTYFPRYGCDRFVLGSVEYRGGFDFDFGGGWDGWNEDDRDWDWHVDASPNWLLFFNAGQGWALGQSESRGARDTGILYDAGAGIVLGDFGIYGAVPLNGDRRPVNVFVRLGARF